MRPLLLCLALFALPAAAQDIDCANAMAQQELNWCAEQDWQRADAALNAAYKAALALLQRWDADLPEAERGGAQALREAQRAWITFRDKACEAEGFAMRGGSAEPLLVYGCMAGLTEDRAAQLRALVDSYADL
ncbi:lysozyme inhibitor LprI family protein [Rhodobacter sp. Har01]|uniref:lysozyme inhibitor LprI family protein n=1 Tax=Rhodobacter sp. Har01 TaxID=2883999 RepID=UPI001D09584A|nr:lysozyme inhibitor LprI family protein [Rhodobacter sp. Har01]MCB6176838.1 lysozyme inhibitor LprI family protein [Rhodobacter sp. Har01]